MPRIEIPKSIRKAREITEPMFGKAMADFLEGTYVDPNVMGRLIGNPKHIARYLQETPIFGRVLEKKPQNIEVKYLPVNVGKPLEGWLGRVSDQGRHETTIPLLKLSKDATAYLSDPLHPAADYGIRLTTPSRNWARLNAPIHEALHVLSDIKRPQGDWQLDPVFAKKVLAATPDKYWRIRGPSYGLFPKRDFIDVSESAVRESMDMRHFALDSLAHTLRWAEDVVLGRQK